MSGIVNLQTQFKEYASDALMKAATSTTFKTGESVYSKATGLYQFSRSTANPGTSDLLADDGLGIFKKVSNPIIYIDDSQYISPLNINPTSTFANLTLTGNTILGDSSSDTITFTGKQVGQLYRNDTGSTVMSLKMHNHDTTSSMNAEFKYESKNTTGAQYGIYNEAWLSATGTCSITASLNAAVVASTFTITGGTIIGCYGQARADGTVAGSSFMAGLYGLIEASAAITASHVCSCWLDSHQANAVTGSHQFLYMTNNGAATMDEAIYIYGGNKVTNLFKLDTVTGMVSATAETGGTSVKIKIDVDGVTHYFNAYTG